LILLAWGMRVVALETVPPGWRDDELINIHALSGELFEGRFPLYFTGASGHEPLYHYLHAGLNAVLGYNVVSGHLLSVILGTLSVVLTFVLGHRLFGFPAAALTSLALATSFWSLMYSRIALRHVSLLPFALTAFYLLWTPLTTRGAPSAMGRAALSDTKTLGWAVPLGGVLGLSLYTYPVSRLLPVMMIVFALYLAIFHRDHFRRAWAGYALALLLAVALAFPLLLAIARGSSEAAAEGIGADARLVELARPIRALRQGDPGPLLETTWTTLNMFHATGDPEALYNLPDRPVFSVFGGLLFWIGVLLCLVRWRRPRYFFLILWLGVGMLPTVLSVPPASLSHSILIQPLTYLLPALAITEGYRSAQRRLAPGLDVSFSTVILVALVCAFLVPVTYRDLRDYFWRWPRYDFVRFLYRADYRDAAAYLDDHPEIQDWAVGSLLMGPWDRLALDVDVQRDDAAVRLFDPQRALVFAGAAPSGSALLTSYPPPAAPIARILREDSAGQTVRSGTSLRHYILEPETHVDQDVPLARFDNGLELIAADWDELANTEIPGNQVVLLTVWRVADTLDLPPMPIVANPPPPGVYSGSRLAVFTHLLASDGAFLVGDDGLWVDPLTLRPGDQFVQLHRFAVPVGAPDGPYAVELGLYDPKTGQRRSVLDAAGEAFADHVLIGEDQHGSPMP
jgi:hypothetical protein